MKSLLLSLAVLFVVPFSLSADDDWFDMQNCEICKCMSGHMDMMMEVKWGVHKTENGMMMISVVPEKHQKTMKAAHDEMMQVVARLEKGEKMHCCGFCTSYGKLKQGGAKIEEIETVGGKVTLVTSDNSEMIKMIHEHATKTMAAHEKMMKEMSGKKSE